MEGLIDYGSTPSSSRSSSPALFTSTSSSSSFVHSAAEPNSPQLFLSDTEKDVLKERIKQMIRIEQKNHMSSGMSVREKNVYILESLMEEIRTNTEPTLFRMQKRESAIESSPYNTEIIDIPGVTNDSVPMQERISHQDTDGTELQLHVEGLNHGSSDIFATIQRHGQCSAELQDAWKRWYHCKREWNEQFIHLVLKRDDKKNVNETRSDIQLIVDRAESVSNRCQQRMLLGSDRNVQKNSGDSTTAFRENMAYIEHNMIQIDRIRHQCKK